MLFFPSKMLSICFSLCIQHNWDRIPVQEKASKNQEDRDLDPQTGMNQYRVITEAEDIFTYV